jgi:hypothetical protein
MQKITSVAGLKDAILLLELEQSAKGQLLKEHFYLIYESLKPVNLLRDALKDISTSPYLIDNILGTSMGIVSGFLSNRIFVGPSGNLLRKLLGSVLQFGVTTVVSQHPDTIKSFGQIIMQYFHRKKEINSKKP